MDMTVLWILVICVGVGLGCSPSDYSRAPDTIAKFAHYSSIVLVAKITNTYPDEIESTAYTVTADVHCVYKSGDYQVPRIVNITEAGYVPGLCHSSDLRVGGTYIIFIRRSFGKLKVDEMEKNATTANLDELAKLCGIERTFPQGVAADAVGGYCPNPVKDNCVKYDPNNVVDLGPPPIPTAVIKPPIPAEETTAGNVDHGKHAEPNATDVAAEEKQDPTKEPPKPIEVKSAPENGASSLVSSMFMVLLVLYFSL